MRRNLKRLILIFGISFLIINTTFLPCIQKFFTNQINNNNPKDNTDFISYYTNVISGKIDTKSNPINKGTIFYVGGSGPNNYTSIQQAIDNTSNDDTVFIYDDSSPYCENIEIINSITLIGENKDTTIIDGCGICDVINVYANQVKIENLIIENGSCTGVGIKIQSYSNLTIENCNIFDNKHAGICIISSSNNIINNCKIKNNTLGILMDNSINNIIFNNFIFNNNFGIELYGTSNNNIFYHNSFFENVLNAYDPGNNIWDNGYPSGGNYWDDYTGEDIFSGPGQNIPGSDHIGDIPYEISPSNNYDNYPLMALYGPPYADYSYYISDKTIYLNASLSFDYDGVIINYEWNLDDGTFKYGEIVNHTYDQYGLYDISLTVYDNDGKTGVNIKPILIDSIPPIIEDYTPSEAAAGSPFTFNVTVDDILISDVYVIYWFDEGLTNNLTMENIGGDIWQKIININMTSESLFYNITAVDGAGNSANTGIKEVTIIPDYPPYKPSNPIPTDGTTGVNLDIDLTWSGGDPDFDDMVWYDIYFGDTNPPEFQETIGPYPAEQTIITHNVETLDYGITYYWKVISKDSHGVNSTEPSEIWSFTTTSIGVRITQPFNIFVIGAIDITAEVEGPGEVDRVEFLIDNITEFTDNEAPYICPWNPIICFRTTPFTFFRDIKVIAYDSEGNTASDEISIFKWRFHPIIVLATILLIIRITSKLRGGFSPLK